MAGNIKNHEAQWCNITSDRFIIDIIRQGLCINFTQPPDGNLLSTKDQIRIFSSLMQRLRNC